MDQDVPLWFKVGMRCKRLLGSRSGAWVRSPWIWAYVICMTFCALNLVVPLATGLWFPNIWSDDAAWQAFGTSLKSWQRVGIDWSMRATVYVAVLGQALLVIGLYREWSKHRLRDSPLSKRGS